MITTFNASRVFHIKKSAQLYIEEIQEKVKINKCVYNSDEYGNFTDGTLSPIFTLGTILGGMTQILSTISNTLNLQFHEFTSCNSCFQKNCMKNGCVQ